MYAKRGTSAAVVHPQTRTYYCCVRPQRQTYFVRPQRIYVRTYHTYLVLEYVNVRSCGCVSVCC